MKIDITVLSGVSAGDVFHFPVDREKPLVVGRATECELVLQDPLVSRKHVQIELRDQGFFLCDLGSTHGTFHMGFQLSPGEPNARLLSDNDEFKIGDLLFRVNFDPTPFKKVEKTAETASSAGGTSRTLSPRQRRLALLGGAAALGLLLLLFLGDSDSGGLPAQKSNEVLLLPTFGVTGYWKGAAGATRTERDQSHLDKAQFELPPSSVVIEFDYSSTAPIDLKIDQLTVEQLAPSPDLWRIRQLIVRGLALGVQRRLIFDNTDAPRAEGADKQAPYKQWAVRDVRHSPLTSTYGIEPGFDNHLRACLSLVEGMDKSPDGLFLLVRGLQTAVIELLNELKTDAIGVSVDLGSDESIRILDPTALQLRLEAIQHERESGSVGADTGSRHLREIASLVGMLDAELWRRVNSRMSQARLAVKIKNSIDAHDALLSAMAMFPAEADYRWTLVNRMFTNPKIVPNRVRDHPQKFRKK